MLHHADLCMIAHAIVHTYRPMASEPDLAFLSSDVARVGCGDDAGACDAEPRADPQPPRRRPLLGGQLGATIWRWLSQRSPSSCGCCGTSGSSSVSAKAGRRSSAARRPRPRAADRGRLAHRASPARTRRAPRRAGRRGMSGTGPAFLAAAAGVGFGHAILPDHWVPLAVLGRTQRYPVSRIARLRASQGSLTCSSRSCSARSSSPSGCSSAHDPERAGHDHRVPADRNRSRIRGARADRPRPSPRSRSRPRPRPRP